ncbi:MAG: response regulator [Oscillatoriaceae bacterium SKW80]|nr:response regulator [Oscillatoriaceae bacterium SKYG93]MCX8120005.1 response regulator [Oscillatoriaceae bacterium SKW80]MDW8454022.1 response regulator [Oscillatoriaceae cyanobacterium SKYGB_i_bin93]HIK29683.1 response regulator [Oscillatoriaceae cyanobacterium M7585_C2015_266]
MIILVVDDSVTMRRMVKASLRGLKNIIYFDEASNGLEAIEKLAIAQVKHIRIDLIVLDLNMPDIHGLEVLKFVRSYEFYQTIPVIILTTRSDDDSRQAAKAAGATCYMTKPFKPQELAWKAQILLN